MHTLHCARNITLCNICDEPIPKREFEEHKQQCPISKEDDIAPNSNNLQNGSEEQHKLMHSLSETKAQLTNVNHLEKVKLNIKIKVK